jgi:hypothetical protein
MEALPLDDVPAVKVYLGLPLFGARAPSGGPGELVQLQWKRSNAPGSDPIRGPHIRGSSQKTLMPFVTRGTLREIVRRRPYCSSMVPTMRYSLPGVQIRFTTRFCPTTVGLVTSRACNLLSSPVWPTLGWEQNGPRI